MNILQAIKNLILAEDIQTDKDYTAPAHRPEHDTLLYKYAERYLNSLNPNHNYDIREELKSGVIITHEEDVSLQEAKDYVRRIWISSSPPNIIVTVTTTW